MAAIVYENYGSDGGAAKVKKTAILIYPQFCSFEISTALEILANGSNRGQAAAPGVACNFVRREVRNGKFGNNNCICSCGTP